MHKISDDIRIVDCILVERNRLIKHLIIVLFLMRDIDELRVIIYTKFETILNQSQYKTQISFLYLIIWSVFFSKWF